MFKNFNPLRAVLAILILFIPLYPKFPLVNVSGTYVAIRLDDIIVVISIIVWLIYEIKHRFSNFRQPITLLFIAYFTAIIASFVSAVFIFQTDPRQILLLNLLRRFEYISLFFLALSTIKKSVDINFTYIFLMIATVNVIIYGYGQKYFHLPVISTMNSEFSKGELLQLDVWTRISSTFAGHYDLAVYLSVVLVIIGGVVVTQKKFIPKIINIIVWLCAFHILTLTASRVSVFAFFGGMCLTLFLLRKYLWIIPVTIIFTFSLINSKDLNQRLLATVPALQHQISQYILTTTPVPTLVIAVVPTPIQIGSSAISTSVTKTTPVPTIIHHPTTEEVIPIDADVGVARSGEIRFNVEWPRAITAFRKNYLLGTGLGSITLATDNDFLRTLGESGLLGLITFGAIFFYFFFNSLSSLNSKNKSAPIVIILFGAMITFLINGSLIDVFEASKTAYLFWIMMGIYYQVLHFSHEA